MRPRTRRLLKQANRYLKCGNRKRLGWLLESYPELRTLSGDGLPSLVWTAFHRRRDLLGWLLEYGCDGNTAESDGDTLLINAAAQDDANAVRLLIDFGAEIDATNDRGETAFSFACAWNSFRAARVLAERGANINTVDAGGGSPLDWAVCHAAPEFREWLISIGAKRNDMSYEPWSWPPKIAVNCPRQAEPSISASVGTT